MSKRPTRKPGVSRRIFLQKAVAGAGATAAAALGTTSARAATDSAGQSAAGGVAPVRVPAEFAAGSAADPIRFEFPMTGAQVFARACEQEGVAALFACPGNYSVVNPWPRPGFPHLVGGTKARWRMRRTRSFASPAKSPSHQGRRARALPT